MSIITNFYYHLNHNFQIQNLIHHLEFNHFSNIINFHFQYSFLRLDFPPCNHMEEGNHSHQQVIIIIHLRLLNLKKVVH